MRQSYPPNWGDDPLLMERAASLEKRDSAEALWEGALEAFAEIGLPLAIYLQSDPDGANLMLRTNIPEIYSLSDPAADPFLAYCCESYDATRTGVGFLPNYDYLQETERAFIRSAETVGFRTGFGIPTRLTGSPRFGGFNLGSPMAPEGFEARIAPQLADIRGFCLLLHRRFEEFEEQAAPSNGLLETLSPREREILKMVCSGASRKECARALSLSPNTVAEYTKSAYRKLGVRNRAEAAQHLRGNGRL